jgi:hypothetical protein
MAGARQLRQIRLRDCYRRLLTGARRWPELFIVSITHESDASKLEKFLPSYLRADRHGWDEDERAVIDGDMCREWNRIFRAARLSSPDAEDGPFRSGIWAEPAWIGRFIDMRLFGESIEEDWPVQEGDDDDQRQASVDKAMAQRITAFESIAEICYLELRRKGPPLPTDRTTRINLLLDAMLRQFPTLCIDGVKVRYGSVFLEMLWFLESMIDANCSEDNGDWPQNGAPVEDNGLPRLNFKAQKALDYIKSHDGCKGVSVSKHIGLKVVESFYSRYVPLLREHGVYNDKNGDGYYWKPIDGSSADPPPSAT